MLIRKETIPHFCIVKRQDGFGRKAHFTDLLRLTSDEHSAILTISCLASAAAES